MDARSLIVKCADCPRKLLAELALAKGTLFHVDDQWLCETCFFARVDAQINLPKKLDCDLCETALGKGGVVQEEGAILCAGCDAKCVCVVCKRLAPEDWQQLISFPTLTCRLCRHSQQQRTERSDKIASAATVVGAVGLAVAFPVAAAVVAGVYFIGKSSKGSGDGDGMEDRGRSSDAF